MNSIRWNIRGNVTAAPVDAKARRALKDRVIARLAR